MALMADIRATVDTRVVAGMTEAREAATGVAVVAVTGMTMDLHATAVAIMHPHQAGSRLLLGRLASVPVCLHHLRLPTTVTVVDMVAEATRSLMAMAAVMGRLRLRLASTTAVAAAAVVVVEDTKVTLSLLLPVGMTTAMEADEADMAVAAVAVVVVVVGDMIAVDMAMAVDTGVEKYYVGCPKGFVRLE